MAQPLRRSQLPYGSEILVEGLFVCGASNASALDIPHLPVLGDESSDISIFSSECDYDSAGIICPEFFDVFGNGDIVFVDNKRKIIRSVLTASSNANTLLVTEQCDNRCLFCSQPPNKLPDSWLYHNAALSILNFNSTEYVGISGGEPTINKHGFIRLLETLECYKNKTPLHILTNGRSLSSAAYFEELKEFIKCREILWGIPIYGHCGNLHDKLVDAEGAFLETVNGIYNLGGIKQRIEVRIVPVKGNVEFLDDIVNFISYHMPFVDVISVMNLEPRGWARHRYESLYVNPLEYSGSLQRAIDIAFDRGLNIRLFNYPLCQIDASLKDIVVKSISDWKNYYPDECGGCADKLKCGGLFTSSVGSYFEKVEPF